MAEVAVAPASGTQQQSAAAAVPPTAGTTNGTGNAAATTAVATASTGITAANGNTTTNNNAAVPISHLEMKLLDLRLKPSTSIIQSIVGEYTTSTGENNEVALLKAGGTIEIYRIIQKQSNTSSKEDGDEGEDDEEDDEPTFILKLITRMETRSILRCCCTIRLSGSKRDILFVGSDSGAFSVIDFDGGVGKIVHCVTFGKTGCRRDTPGQYLSGDPKGRAIMISSIEKRKLVYVINRDSSGKPTIASPLEAHRNRTITYDTIGLDNGYDNPIFACLEVQYPDTGAMVDDAEEEEDNGNSANNNNTDPNNIEKQIAYYELDLGLNHVSRRWATTVHRTACCLAAVPGGGTDGPGGVLIGGEDYIEYVHETHTDETKDDKSGKATKRIICTFPRRKLHPPSKGVLIQSITVHRKKKSKFFALAQSELGDVYKIIVELDKKDKTKVIGMNIALLDTLPVTTINSSLNIFKSGMLFIPSEFADHVLYQFIHIDLPNAPTCTYDETRNAFLQSDEKDENKFYALSENAHNICTAISSNNDNSSNCLFSPTTLKNLRKIYTLDNTCSTSGILVGELAGNEVSPQIYTLNGRGPRSSLRILRHGAAITELAISDLPGTPGGIFTVTDNSADSDDAKKTGSSRRNDRYIVVSFADATLVLSVGETVEEVGRESGFITNAPTLACCALGSGSSGSGGIVQVTPSGVRHIHQGRVKNWDCPGLKRIECASCNENQVIIALAGGEVTYFEVDAISGNLQETATRDFGTDVCCLDVGTIQKGRTRSMFAAIGCRDLSIRIVSLEPGNNTILTQRSSAALKARPHSVVLQQLLSGTQGDSNMMDTSDDSGNGGQFDTVLTVGLDDGSSIRTNIDPITGSIGTSPTRRFLGARPVSVSRITIENHSATLLLSSRPWISRLDVTSGKHIMAPLSYAPLDHGHSFTSDAIRDGIVATAGKTLRILSVDTGSDTGGYEDESFNTNKIDLRYTPRQMTLLSTTAGNNDGNQQQQRKIVLAVVESDYNDYGYEEKKAMGFDFTGEGKNLGKAKKDKGSGDGDDDGMDMDEDSDEEKEEKEKDDEEDDDDEEDEEEKEARITPIRGPIPSEPGHWGSCVRLLDPSDNCTTLDCVEMNRSEAALCCTSVRFHSRGGEPLLAIGTVTGMTMHPLKVAESHVVLYRIVNGERLQLLHRTKVVDGPVLALAHFQGRLLVGVGKSLRLYEMGKRQLLKKCELRGLPTMVKTLQAAGDRAFVGDMLRSLQIVRYDVQSNRLVLVAHEPYPRPVASQELLDWNTAAVGDKFGNIVILRLPRGADNAAVDLTGTRALWDSSREDLTPKLEMLCQYYVGEVVTSMTRASLVAGGAESLIYVTVTGRVGALVPFKSREDVEFYEQLENCLRTDAPRPTGRDPSSYRSYYAPVKHVIDGDLCDAFNSLKHEEQTKIADKLDRTVGEVMKKLEDTRNALL